MLRPFRELSEAGLHGESLLVAARLRARLAAFDAVLSASASGMGIEVYRRSLHELLEQLARDERRLMALADELLLREHWRALEAERRTGPPDPARRAARPRP